MKAMMRKLCLMVVCLTYKEKPMKPKELSLLKDVFPDSEPTNPYENQNSWLIEIITIAAENYGFSNGSEYQEKIILLQNNPIYGLSKQDLFWLADKFARVFARVKYRYDYYYYHTQFFLIFFGKEKKSIPNNLFWSASTSKRLEKKALERVNPNQPIFFNSGASAYSDFVGYTSGNNPLPVGVQIQLCSQRVKELMLKYNAKGGRVFVDTGSFSCFRKGGQNVDFDKVLKAYFDLVEKAQKPDLLSLVAPDFVGSQQATLKLLKQYKKQLFKLICLGVDLIVPIQLGNLSLEETYKEAVTTLGTKAFRVGIPSNEKAVKLEQLLQFVSTVQPNRLHLLGLRCTKFDEVVAQIKAIAPNTHVSADATTLRSKLKKGSQLVTLIETKTKQAVAEILCANTSVYSYEALVNGIFHQLNFLTENQAKHLAKLISQSQEEQERIISVALSGICGVYNGSRLGDLLEKYYEKEVVSQALTQFAETLARRAVSGEIRAAAIAQIQNKIPA